MNRERMLDLADFFEHALADSQVDGDEFMRSPSLGSLSSREILRLPRDTSAVECGTRGCVAGWAVFLHGDRTPGGTFTTPDWYAQHLLELDDSQRLYLFYGDWWDGPGNPRLNAARKLREMAS